VSKPSKYRKNSIATSEKPIGNG
ncbi:uncharacterized protein METZ01_LOCUS427295, partial [marine metagenome]